jgi:hypothetical protein
MNIKKQIKKISKFSSIGLLAIGFVVGLVVMYLYFQPKLTYQVKTAQESFSKYNTLEKYKCTGNDVKDYLKSVASAEAYKEGKSKVIDFSSMSWNAVDKCSNAFEAYQQYEIDNPQPTPTPAPVQTNTIELPSYCNTVIQAWEAQGYDRALTNQMMKKDHPECTY